MAGKFDLKRTDSGKFMFNLLAGNNQVILTSELYDSKSAAQKGIASVRQNAGEDSRFERKSSKNGDPYFVLMAGNGRQIGRSEMYTGVAAMENGIASVTANAPTAEIVDNT